MKASWGGSWSDLPKAIKPRSRWLLLILLPLAGALFFAAALKAVSPVDYANSDFFTFWLSGHLAAKGQDPYLASTWTGAHQQFGATWIPNATFIYPQPLSLMFVPLGLLPLYTAFIIWAVVSQFMIVASLVLLLRARPDLQASHLVLPLAAGVIIFRPTMVTLHNGQLAGLLLLVESAVVYLWERGKWGQGAVLLPILALKPNLGVPVILFLSIYLVYRRQARALLLGALAGVLLIALGLLQNPAWIGEFWHAGNSKLSQIFGSAPTIWGISAYYCSHQRPCSVAFGTVGATVILIGCAWLVWSRRRALSPMNGVALASTAMLLLTPTAWPYDQLLLVIPVLAATLGLAEAQYPFLPTALIFLAVDVIAWVLLGISASTQTEIWNAAIPLIVLGLIAWHMSADRSARQPLASDTP